MTSGRRKAVALGVLSVILAGLALWANGQRSAARAQAERASRDLQACRKLARKIERLRHRPNQAGARELEFSVLNARVEGAARMAAVARDRIAGIQPKPARRVGNTVYNHKPTEILLDAVSMKQLVVFLHTLISGSPGLHVSSLRLSASRGQESQDSWAAEVVVSYLIYAPPRAGPPNVEDWGF